MIRERLEAEKLGLNEKQVLLHHNAEYQMYAISNVQNTERSEAIFNCNWAAARKIQSVQFSWAFKFNIKTN